MATKLCPSCSTLSETDGGFCPQCGASYSRAPSYREAEKTAVQGAKRPFAIAGVLASTIGLLLVGGAPIATLVAGILGALSGVAGRGAEERGATGTVIYGLVVALLGAGGLAAT
jgi:uncharacterized membrane protein YeaQ/YmgE (transglycosylase-associated protein family)